MRDWGWQQSNSAACISLRAYPQSQLQGTTRHLCASISAPSIRPAISGSAWTTSATAFLDDDDKPPLGAAATSLVQVCTGCTEAAPCGGWACGVSEPGAGNPDNQPSPNVEPTCRDGIAEFVVASNFY